MRDPRAFRVALAELSATNARINALIDGDPRDAEDIPGWKGLDRARDRWFDAVTRHAPATRADLVALATVMTEPGIVDFDEGCSKLGDVLAPGVVAILGRPRAPRLARAVAAYGIALFASGLSHVGLWLARGIERRRAPPASADVRLAALADEMEAITRDAEACKERHAGAWTEEREGEFDEIIGRYEPVQGELAVTPAASVVGVLAKARACQVGVLRDLGAPPVALSAVDDIHRLFGGHHG